MRTTGIRVALAATVAPALLLLAPATAVADSPDLVRPVVLIGQTNDPLGALLACSPVGLIPLFGPNIILPICVV